MVELRNIERAVIWFGAALCASLPVLLLFFTLAPTDWHYGIGIALSEVVGLVCLAVSPFRFRTRGLSMALFMPVDMVMLYYVGMILAARFGGE